MTPRRVQARTLEARRQIVGGAIAVLARDGVPGLTHRAVARAAGVGTASTTHHFDSKLHILQAAADELLDGYLAGFRRLSARVAAGGESRIRSLAGLERRVTETALLRDRQRSLAWCEIVLHGGRSAEGRAMVQRWYRALDAIWDGIHQSFGADPAVRPAAAIDRVVGRTFLLHPLCPGTADLAAMLDGARDPVPGPAAPPPLLPPADSARGRVLAAAIDVLCREGAAALTHRAVAERAGMARSGPSHHFPTLEGLLNEAQAALSARARARYREGAGALGPDPAAPGALADLSTAIFLREALEYPGENLGTFSAWIAAARAGAPSAGILAQLQDQNRAWQRRVAQMAPGHPSPRIAALELQAAFVGRLIRILTTERDMAGLARLRGEFLADLAQALRC